MTGTEGEKYTMEVAALRAENKALREEVAAMSVVLGAARDAECITRNAVCDDCEEVNDLLSTALRSIASKGGGVNE